MRDAGLQAERTALAWSRTGLAILGNAVLALRGGLVSQKWSVLLLGGVLLVAAAATFVYSVQRRRELTQGVGPVAAPAAAIAAIAMVALAASFIGLVSTLAT